MVSATAYADGVTVVRSQFTDRVEHGQPVGGAAEATGAATGAYWMEMNNAGAPTSVTVVWSVNGHEVGRQSLDVGHAPRWRTWAFRHLHNAHDVSVSVLDASGHAIHADHLGGTASR